MFDCGAWRKNSNDDDDVLVRLGKNLVGTDLNVEMFEELASSQSQPYCATRESELSHENTESSS